MSSFDQRAQEWDKKNIRVEGAKKIAQAIQKQFPLNKDMELMDFGVGTGLLGFELAKKVKQVYGVDTSLGMLEKLQEKNRDDLHIIPIHQDIIQKPLQKDFDGIVSSMTLHHIKELEKFFQQIYYNIKPSGFLAIADLMPEDGTFHSDNKGVFHFGFEPKILQTIVENAGFHNIVIEVINTIEKPHKSFEIFLLTASK